MANKTEYPSADEQRAYWGGSDGRGTPVLSSREIGWYGDIERRVITSWDSDGCKRYRLTDKRGQKVVRACLVCHQVRLLRLSHVHPKWTGQAHRQEGGVNLGYLAESGSEMRVERDFTKHYLLCDECEQFVSESERYVSLLSRGQPASLQSIGATRHSDNLVTGLRRDLVFRFFASFLLRSHGAASAPHVRLPYSLANELRTSIVHNSYSSARHQLLIQKTFTRARGANPRAVAIRYIEDRLPLFRFEGVLGGLYFIYFMRAPDGKNARWFDDEFRIICEWGSMQESTARLLPVELFDLNVVKIDAGADLELDVHDLLPPFDPEAPCPCGWKTGPLRECCGSTWLRDVLEHSSDLQGQVP